MSSIQRSFAAAILCVCPAIALAVVAQSATPPKPPTGTAVAAIPQFDVAAIHLHQPEPHEHNSIWSSSFDGQFKATNISVVMLIRWAYEMPETRILGAPSWASSTMFNIDAKADPAVDRQLHSLTSDAGRSQKERMVQALLADRFKLVTHIEMRELPTYALVVDQTGIAGRYDLTVKWTPDDRVPSTDSSDASRSGPSLYTALQEQLGLKLEPTKGPVEVLVIDHVEKPSEN